MEAVLDVYPALYNPKRPVICVDETTKPLLSDERPSLAMQPGHGTRDDDEYERHGTRNLFLFFEPLPGWPHVEITRHRAKADWAYCMRALVERWYPEAKGLRLVMDNMNTHHLASLYEAFAPTGARRLAQKLEIHDTPKHGSWLNMAEILLVRDVQPTFASQWFKEHEHIGRTTPFVLVIDAHRSPWLRQEQDAGFCQQLLTGTF